MTFITKNLIDLLIVKLAIQLLIGRLTVFSLS